MEYQTPKIDKTTLLAKNSVTLKLVVITVLMLLLLIPSSMIQNIIHERENMSTQATHDVSSKWAGKQMINGPILTIPVIYEEIKESKKMRITKNLTILPEALNIIGTLDPKSLKRGIHKVVVYNSDLLMKGTFDLNKKIDSTNLIEIQYHKAFLTIGISDLRGIKDELVLEWNNQKLKVEPGSRISGLIHSGVTVDLPTLTANTTKPVAFSMNMKIRGSQTLSVTPIGSITTVSIESPWKDPSFNGNFLPDHRDVNDKGFKANWKVLQLNRNYPQFWLGNSYGNLITDSAFGLDLILPIDDYQKSMRSSKYAVMMIALTFLIFFLVEVLNKRKIHPFQYILVGLGLCLFYTLLVSISEHSDFNTAYLISATAIVSMISIYSFSVFRNTKFSILLLFTLSAIYGFLFITLQLADYALLMGSIGLTTILGLTMYFTRNINWYQLTISEE